MPISFEQPGPVAPGLSAMGGAAEMYARTLPEITQMMGRTTGILGQQLQFQQQQALQAQHAQQQSVLSQQHAAQQLQGDLTIAERNRMQQLQNARASVMVNPDLTDQDRQQFLGMIQQGLDPLQARSQAAQQQAQQMQLEQLKQHGMMQGMIAKTQQDVMNNSESGTVPVYAKQMDGGQGPLIGHKVWDGQKYHFHEYHDPMATQPEINAPEGWATTKEWNAKAGRWHVQMKPPQKTPPTPRDLQAEQEAKEQLAENKAVHDFIQHTYTELLKQTEDKTSKEGVTHTTYRYDPDKALDMAHAAGAKHREHLRAARTPPPPLLPEPTFNQPRSVGEFTSQLGQTPSPPTVNQLMQQQPLPGGQQPSPPPAVQPPSPALPTMGGAGIS